MEVTDLDHGCFISTGSGIRPWYMAASIDHLMVTDWGRSRAIASIKLPTGSIAFNHKGLLSLNYFDSHYEEIFFLIRM